ncbi:MAG: hypothetical protein JWQ53_338 [Klenkia sp.]|nr:hypothetical protein [Klenkia sp.]
MSDERDEQGRPESPRYGQDPSPGSSGWGQPSDQPPYGPASYGQPAYGQGGYDQGGYVQPAYGQEASPYGYQAAYGQGGVQGYGWGAPPPARPGGVITAAVLGLVFGAIGVLVTALFLVGGAALTGASSGANSLDDDLGLGDLFGSGFAAAAGVVFVLGLLALVWTVLAIWGSAWALTGRSRVLLLVAGSISVAATGLAFIGALANAGQEGSAGGVVVTLLFFAGAIAIVVLLSLSPASQFFAAHRARRTAVG